MLVASTLVITGCTRQGSEKPYIARVDDAVVTEEELMETGDRMEDSSRRIREYVSQWVTSELLYKEAERRGILESEGLQSKLAETRRRLAISALLDAEVYADDSTLITDDDIRASYDTSSNTYLLTEDVANISFVLFTERDAANTFRSKVLRGASWNEAVAQMEGDSLMRSQVLQIADHQYFTEGTLYPEELWKLARTLTKEQVSYIIKTNVGYYVVMVHGFKKKGDIAEFDYIREEIRDRLLIERRREKYDRFLTNLRSEHTVEVKLAVPDTVGGE